MSGEYEVGCDGCGQRHVTSAEQARKQRVLRCACGQFVRLDLGLAELRSEPAPAPRVELGPAVDDEEDEATHMLSSLAAVAALGRSTRSAHARASQASIHEEDRGSRPVPRSTLRSLSPSPSKYPSAPPAADKPLWYVDLGGSETVEMTIEQLIIARRSGKLGEGALVWREGMPRWRPVGTLIPATSIAAARSTPIPPAPSRPPLPAPAPLPSRPPSRSAPPAPLRSPPPPTRASDVDPSSLASYERPFATLEFALEKPDELGPTAHGPLPSVPRAPSRPAPRGLTPMPRPATWLSGPASVPNAAAPSRTSVPPPPPPLRSPVLAAPSRLPLPSPLPAPRATPIPTPLPSFTSDRPVEMPVANAAWDWLGDRPRWVSACIALAVCITASGSGAFLVRTLKMHRQPLALTSTTSGVNQPLPGATAPNHSAPLAPAAAASAPLVVDLQSLSVEPNAPRHAARPAPAPVIKPVATTEASAPGVESPDAPEDEPSPASQNKPKNSSLPSAAHTNPYTTGSDSDDGSATK